MRVVYNDWNIHRIAFNVNLAPRRLETQNSTCILMVIEPFYFKEKTTSSELTRNCFVVKKMLSITKGFNWF